MTPVRFAGDFRQQCCYSWFWRAVPCISIHLIMKAAICIYFTLLTSGVLGAIRDYELLKSRQHSISFSHLKQVWLIEFQFGDLKPRISKFLVMQFPSRFYRSRNQNAMIDFIVG